MHKNHPLSESVEYAYEGLRFTFINGRNFKIQLGFGTLALLLGYVLKIATFEWVELILIIALVLILEMINTAIETVVDMVSLKFHPLAKITKDCAAGAVLVASIASVFIGFLIFLPKILVS
jgi:diacylglycerol kinase